ncbi:hypothetical protein KM043_000588 [Ampulex compressa]|nr:hypothetical protein KM043_000588 [Ampulex compressa]
MARPIAPALVLLLLIAAAVRASEPESPERNRVNGPSEQDVAPPTAPIWTTTEASVAAREDAFSEQTDSREHPAVEQEDAARDRSERSDGDEEEEEEEEDEEDDEENGEDEDEDEDEDEEREEEDEDDGTGEEYEDELKAIAESHEAMSRDETRNSEVSGQLGASLGAEGSAAAEKSFDSHEASPEEGSDEDVASNEALIDEVLDKNDREVAELLKYKKEKNLNAYAEGRAKAKRVPTVKKELSTQKEILMAGNETGAGKSPIPSEEGPNRPKEDTELLRGRNASGAEMTGKEEEARGGQEGQPEIDVDERYPKSRDPAEGPKRLDKRRETVLKDLKSYLLAERRKLEELGVQENALAENFLKLLVKFAENPGRWERIHELLRNAERELKLSENALEPSKRAFETTSTLLSTTSPSQEPRKSRKKSKKRKKKKPKHRRSTSTTSTTTTTTTTTTTPMTSTMPPPTTTRAPPLTTTETPWMTTPVQWRLVAERLFAPPWPHESQEEPERPAKLRYSLASKPRSLPSIRELIAEKKPGGASDEVEGQAAPPDNGLAAQSRLFRFGKLNTHGPSRPQDRRDFAADYEVAPEATYQRLRYGQAAPAARDSARAAREEDYEEDFGYQADGFPYGQEYGPAIREPGTSVGGGWQGSSHGYGGRAWRTEEQRAPGKWSPWSQNGQALWTRARSEQRYWPRQEKEREYWPQPRSERKLWSQSPKEPKYWPKLRKEEKYRSRARSGHEYWPRPRAEQTYRSHPRSEKSYWPRPGEYPPTGQPGGSSGEEGPTKERGWPQREQDRASSPPRAGIGRSSSWPAPEKSPAEASNAWREPRGSAKASELEGSNATRGLESSSRRHSAREEDEGALPRIGMKTWSSLTSDPATWPYKLPGAKPWPKDENGKSYNPNADLVKKLGLEEEKAVGWSKGQAARRFSRLEDEISRKGRENRNGSFAWLESRKEEKGEEEEEEEENPRGADKPRYGSDRERRLGETPSEPRAAAGPRQTSTWTSPAGAKKTREWPRLEAEAEAEAVEEEASSRKSSLGEDSWAKEETAATRSKADRRMAERSTGRPPLRDWAEADSIGPRWAAKAKAEGAWSGERSEAEAWRSTREDEESRSAKAKELCSFSGNSDAACSWYAKPRGTSSWPGGSIGEEAEIGSRSKGDRSWLNPEASSSWSSKLEPGLSWPSKPERAAAWAAKAKGPWPRNSKERGPWTPEDASSWPRKSADGKDWSAKSNQEATWGAKSNDLGSWRRQIGEDWESRYGKVSTSAGSWPSRWKQFAYHRVTAMPLSKPGTTADASPSRSRNAFVAVSAVSSPKYSGSEWRKLGPEEGGASSSRADVGRSEEQERAVGGQARPKARPDPEEPIYAWKKDDASTARLAKTTSRNDLDPRSNGWTTANLTDGLEHQLRALRRAELWPYKDARLEKEPIFSTTATPTVPMSNATMATQERGERTTKGEERDLDRHRRAISMK